MFRQKILSIGIEDCRVDTFRSGGKGGQNQNKVESGVRVFHAPSGAVGEARDSRDQIHNKKSAFNRMISSQKFKIWLNTEIDKIINQRPSIDEVVDKQMEEKNLKIEYGV